MLDDLIYRERHDHSLARFGPNNNYTAPPDYGETHPDKPGFRLVYVKLVEPDRWYEWVWINDRSDQDSYNYELTYPDGDPNYPLVQRTYLIRRSEYVPLAEGTADPGLDDEGNPVFPNAKMTRQRLIRLDDPTLDSLYVLVQRWFEIVPGKVVEVGNEVDQKYRIIIRTLRQRVALSTLLPVVGVLAVDTFADYGTGSKLEWEDTEWTDGDAYILSAKIVAVEDSNTYGDMVCEVGPIPPTRYEFPSVGFTFPGIFDFLQSWFEAGPADGFTTPHPWAGVDYSMIAPRSMNPTARVTYDYFLEGDQDPVPVKFRVISPAAASRFWRDLPYNTVHPELGIIEFQQVGAIFVSAVVETFPASTPATYDYEDVLLVNCEDQTWRGLIKERTTVEISEETDPYEF